MLNKHSLIAGLVLAALAAAPALADVSTEWFDPKPDNASDKDDLILPLPGPGGHPGEMSIVFQPVYVPGSSFWGTGERLVSLGDPEGRSLFETSFPVEIGGSFAEPVKDRWVIYLGKYELTRAQYAAVMGHGDLKAGFAELEKATENPDLIALKLGSLVDATDTRQKRRRDREFAQPVAGLSYLEWLTFIDTLNKWCFQEPACLAKLPRSKIETGGGRSETVPGYFRMPTESEWEYAARGGYDTLKAGGGELFQAPVPMDDSQWQKNWRNIAWVDGEGRDPESIAKPRQIGWGEPLYGFFDMFGNVQELTSDLFYTRIGNGKPGGIAARGGSHLTKLEDVRASLRGEVPIYQWKEGMRPEDSRMEELGSLTTGLRLALGTYTILSAEFRSEIEKSHKEYLDLLSDRLSSAGGIGSSGGSAARSGSALVPLKLSVKPLDEMKELLKEMRSWPGANVRVLNRMENQINAAQVSLNSSFEATARSSARLALGAAAEFALRLDELEDVERVLQSLSDPRRGLRFEERRDRLRQLLDQDFNKYWLRLIELSEVGEAYATAGMESLDIERSDRLGQAILNLLRRHLKAALTGVRDRRTWRDDLTEELAAKNGFF